ncbi:MAG: hypothetical protein IPI03_16305 [Rubrivivax sp.]|nr:hypothetical protein [Rubrivivax sp.]
MNDYSLNELIACVLAREVRDGDSLQCGANAVVQRSGFLLGHLDHGPNCRVLIGRTFANLWDVPVLQLYDMNVDWRAARWGEYVIPHDESFSWSSRRQISAFAIGALQTDKRGNTNMLGFGDDPKRLKVRGPGGVGTTPVSARLDRYYIMLRRHDRRALVDQCDFVSGIGFGDGPGAREKLGLPGGGPKLCITPLCVFDFDEATKLMRIKSLHPGVTLQQVLDNTGFAPVVPKDIPTTPAPTERELHILRTRIDPKGVLRKVEAVEA